MKFHAPLASIAVIVLMGLVGASVVLSPPPPEERLLGTASFGDSLSSEFQQGWRNGTDTHGKNDHLVPVDDFEGTHLDPTLWEEVESSGLTHRIANQSLHVEHPAPGNVSNISFFAFRGNLTGDFDVRVNISLSNWPDPNATYAVFGIDRDSPGGAYTRYYLFRGHLLGVGNFAFAFDNGTSVGITYTSQLSTAFRFQRTITTIEGSYWNASSGSWTILFTNSSAETMPMRPVIAVAHGNSSVAVPPFAVEFDSFSARGRVADEPYAGPDGRTVGDAVRLLPPADNFDDDFTNPDRWITRLEAGTTASEAGGTFQFTSSFADPITSGELKLRKNLSGSFEVRVEYFGPTMSVPECAVGCSAWLMAEVGGTQYVLSRGSSPGPFKHVYGIGGLEFPTNDTSGTLIIRRGGSELWAGIHNESGWGYWSWGTVPGPAAISFGVSAQGGGPIAPVQFEFDSFRVLADRDLAPVGYLDATFESRVIDTGEDDPGDPVWGDLYFNATTNANTPVRIQLASSDSPTGPWNFRGPDGTGATWFSASGVPSGIASGNRYFRYRAELNSSNATQTPVLWDVWVTATGPSIPESRVAAVLAAATFALAAPLLRRVGPGKHGRLRRGSLISTPAL
jgi:hypothetical protein